MAPATEMVAPVEVLPVLPVLKASVILGQEVLKAQVAQEVLIMD